ncbi:MAG: cardiolipin synthase [Oscillospiraceae bacterium]|nr:cardiolipin synthase [Oscillospiraceae bacterium]
MNKLKRFVFTRKFFIVLLALFQICFFLTLTVRFYTAGAAIYMLMTILSVLIILYMFERDDMNPAYKISWLIVMIILPVSGAVFYALWGDTKMTKKQKQQMEQIVRRTNKVMKPNQGIIDRTGAADKSLAKQMLYLQNVAFAPAYENTAVKYYDTGAAYFRDMLADMEKAENSIFLQYFIIDQGYMWDRVLSVLKEKAARGVDVRLIYDGWGCMVNFPRGYEETLRSCGIKVCVFNDVKFSLHIGDYLMLNHRDHRKIAVIDSAVGYSGGINIADEYINYVERFGVWKDTGFRLEGDAVWSLTATFIQTWEYGCGEKLDYNNFSPDYSMETDGIVQPYFDTPMDKNNVCANAYLNIINNAKDYVYIATPYLVIDNEMLTALTLAARSGIDVRIVVPGIPDKWYVYYVTQSYYKALVDAGVKIYEYTPGFVHAKMYVSDDVQAIVGGANTDYRSMYLNFENCCSFYGGSITADVKADFENMFTHSHLVTMQDIENVSFLKRLYQIVFRVLGPMM